jgi:hypothetical protein
VDVPKVTKPNELLDDVSQDIARRAQINLFTLPVLDLAPRVEAYNASKLSPVSESKQKTEMAVKLQGPISVKDMGKSRLIYEPFLC